MSGNKKIKRQEYSTALKIQNELRKKILARKIDDAEIFQAMTKQKENYLGVRYEEDERKIDDLLDRYGEATSKDEQEIYFNQLPKSIQREIKKAKIQNIVSPASTSAPAPGAVDLSAIEDKINDMEARVINQLNNTAASVTAANKNFGTHLGQVIGQITNLNKAITVMETELKSIPNSITNDPNFTKIAGLETLVNEIVGKVEDIKNEIAKTPLSTNAELTALKTSLVDLEATLKSVEKHTSDPRLEQLMEMIGVLKLEISDKNYVYYITEYSTHIGVISNYLFGYANKKYSTPTEIAAISRMKPQNNVENLLKIYAKMQALEKNTNIKGALKNSITADLSKVHSLITEARHTFANIAATYIDYAQRNKLPNEEPSWLPIYKTLDSDFAEQVKAYLLVKQSKAGPSSSKGNAKGKAKGSGMKIFTSPKEIQHRLKIIEGSIGAGNDSHLLLKEKKELEKIMKKLPK